MKLSRRKGRFARRAAKRHQKKVERSDALGTLEDLFPFHKMYRYGKKCCCNTRWKRSIQYFELHLFSGTAKRRRKVINHKYKWKKFNSFTINERGKTRPIDAPHVDDRQVHKVITKEILLPLYLPDMIHNNGASLEGKGLEFSRKHLEKDLHHIYNKYGMAGHIILADCTGFFPNADHDQIISRHDALMFNRHVKHLCDSVIDQLPTDVGVPLGVEPSQVEMIAYPSPLDNYMKCQVGLEVFGHYMDDYLMYVPEDQDPEEVLQIFIDKATSIGLTISRKKTKIVPFGKPFRFCKAKYQISETGHITVNGCRGSAKRGRRKIRYFHKLVSHGTMTYENLWSSTQGIFNYFEKFDDHGRVLKLRRYFYNLYGFSPEKIETFREQEELHGLRCA